MREVSQKWLNNQNKTLRDQGLLRLDFLSAHNNNAYAHIIPMGSDASKSNINEIKEIYPYGAPTKNLAMPNLMGKTEISAGVYRLTSQNGGHLDYNIFTGHYRMHGSFTGGLTYNFGVRPSGDHYAQIWEVSKINYDGTVVVFLGGGSNYQVTIYNNMPYNGRLPLYASEYLITLYKDNWSGGANVDVTFKVQLEKGSTATDYVVPQPNTGYVSSNISGPNGEVATNLAMPDLTGKEYLGDGVYRIYSATNRYYDYNVYNGNNIIKSTSEGSGPIYTFNVPTGTYTITVESNNKYQSFYIQVNGTPFYANHLYGGVKRVFTFDNVTTITICLYESGDLTTEFKLQLEQGSTASAYQLPNFTPIEVNVENYRSPLNGLTITWSENFGHAVDYSIEYNGEIYTYLNNTKKTVFVPIIVENTPDANFKIRVNKWSQGGEPIRIERIFVGLHIINYQDRIFSYTKKRVNDVLSLELPQDEINFELSNIDRMFDPLWYNSYFKYLNEKTEIRVYSGFRLDGKNEEWIKNGTFYLTDWKAPNNSITASFTARDILNLLDADEMYSKSGALTLDDYCDIMLGRDYKGVDNFEDYNLPVNPDGSKKWNIRKNSAVPDLTGKPEISEGVYRLHTYIGGVTLDYNYWSGEFILNGTSPQQQLYNIQVLQQGTHTLSFHYVSGSMAGSVSEIGLAVVMPPPHIGGTYVYINKFTNTGESKTYTHTDNLNLDIILWSPNETYNNYTFKIQLEQGVEATDYELPIENANVPVSMETRTKREVLQLLAQSVNAHIHLNDDANISFIRDVTGYNLNADKKIMTTKPEFNIAAPVKKIIVPISTYASDPNELELARIQVTAGETIEINHDLPYSGGRVEVSGALTVASQDNTWFRSYKIVVGGSGSGELVLFRHQMARTTINILQDVGSSGTSMTYENPMIDTKLKASRALTKIWSEISNSRQVEFDLRIDPLFNTLDAVSFPFKVLDLEQTEFMRIDELEINYNGAYKGKIKGVILSNYGGDLTDKTYIKHSKEFNSGEENLKWHLSNK